MEENDLWWLELKMKGKRKKRKPNRNDLKFFDNFIFETKV